MPAAAACGLPPAGPALGRGLSGFSATGPQAVWAGHRRGGQGLPEDATVAGPGHCRLSLLARVAHRLAVIFQLQQQEVNEAPEVVKGGGCESALRDWFDREVRVLVAADGDEPDDLIIAEADHGVVDAVLVQAEPVIVRLSVWPDAEALAVDADAGPLAEPACGLLAWADAGEAGRLQVKTVQADFHRATVQLAGAGPALVAWRGCRAATQSPVAVEGRLKLRGGLDQEVSAQLAGVVGELITVENDLERIPDAKRGHEAGQPRTQSADISRC